MSSTKSRVSKKSAAAAATEPQIPLPTPLLTTTPHPPPPVDDMEAPAQSIQQVQKRLQTLIDNYHTTFIQHIKSTVNSMTEEEFTQLEKYPKLQIKRDNIVVKKEPPVVEESERCIAKRCDNTQCTRRKKKGCKLCGTHEKCAQYGLIDVNSKNNKEVVVQVKEIQGIAYYIDNQNNVYNTEDVLEGRKNPNLIGKYNEETKSIMFI